MAEKTALDAINEALGTAASGAPDPNAGAPDDDNISTASASAADDHSAEAGGDDADGTGDGDLGGEGDKPEGDEGDADADAEGDGAEGEGGEQPEIDPKTGKPVEKGPNGERERNPDGTWKKAEVKKPDPVNDPIPKELKQETRARMQSLVDTVKEKDTQLAEVKQNFDYMVGGIQATGATPEQYGETLSWLALFNSGDPAQQAKALELVESVADRLATLLGKERNVSDPLAAHADLQEAVRLGKTTPEFAKEIARNRNGQTFRTELTQTATTQAQQIQQTKQVEQQARNDLTTLEETLRSVDGREYDSIKSVIVPVLKPVMAAISPAQWKQKFSEAYKAEKDRRAAARAATASSPKTPVNQPLRAGKNPAGGQARQPASAAEALNAALSSMK
jgi:hypothetical protein